MPAQNVARPPCVRLTPTSDRAQELVLARAQAITNQVFVVRANAAGPAARGRSVIVDPEGLVRVEAGGPPSRERVSQQQVRR